MPDDAKYKLLLQYQTNLTTINLSNSNTPNDSQSSPKIQKKHGLDYYINMLKNTEKITPEELSSLRIEMSSQSKAWYFVLEWNFLEFSGIHSFQWNTESTYFSHYWRISLLVFRKTDQWLKSHHFFTNVYDASKPLLRYDISWKFRWKVSFESNFYCLFTNPILALWW